MYYLRHFESENNALGGVLNSGDPALSERGIAEGELVAAQVAQLGLEVFLCSPARRAIQSVDVINSYLPDPIPVIVRNELDELRWGSAMAGKKVDDAFTPEVNSRAILEDIDFRLCDDGESYAEVFKRMLAGHAGFLGEAGMHVGVMSHSTSEKVLFGIRLGLSRPEINGIKIHNGDINVFDPAAAKPAPPELIYTLK
jgi:broad specificity phosphatase PhoE